MATEITSLNAIDLMKRQLEIEVKKQVTKELVDAEVKKFKEMVEIEISQIMKRVTFVNIERIMDMVKIRDELRIHIEINKG